MKKYRNSRAKSLFIFLMIASALLFSTGCTRTTGVARHMDGSTLFMSYAGPVFPLVIQGEDEGITVSRDITFDFGGGIREARISDAYTLTNNTADDITVTVAYPFAGNFHNLYRIFPAISMNDSVIQTEILAGFHQSDICSWEDYVALLSGGEHWSRAMADAPELNQTVIVYEFTNVRADHSAAVNPMFVASFNT